MKRILGILIMPIAWVLGLDRLSARIVWGRIILALVPMSAVAGALTFYAMQAWNDDSKAVPSPVEATASLSSTGSAAAVTSGAGAEGQGTRRAIPSTTVPAAAPTKSPQGSDGKEPWPVSLAGKLAWPVALLFAVLLVIFSKNLRTGFGAGARLVKTIRAGGIEMELDAQRFEEVRDHLRSSFRELIADARDEYERMADLQDVREKLANVFDGPIKAKFGSATVPSDLRATVHVRDVIIREFLYQLVDYVPKGGGAHRRFSQRYGIIGRTWRSKESHGTGNAFGGLTSEEALVEQWGMTKEEAHGMLQSKHSCLSILLISDGSPTGLLYVDTDVSNAFGSNDDAKAFAKAMESDPKVIDLAAAVERTMTPLRAAAPNLDIRDFA